MKQYLKLLEDILENGTWKDPARVNLPRTKSLFGTRMEFDMADGFPLLTTKKMYFKGIVTELLWFLRGDTNIKYLVDNGCNIWNQDAYRWYLKTFSNYPAFEPMSIEQFIDQIKSDELLTFEVNYKLGDLGKVYGHQWRKREKVYNDEQAPNYENKIEIIDQIQNIIDRLQSDPMGRYAILDAWNPSDFNEMALPPCHLLYQFNCRPMLFSTEDEITNDTKMHYLDLQLYQRSCDTFLGVPFNIASGAALLHIIAKAVNMQPGKFIWVGGDTHIYENHIEAVEEQLKRTPTKLPTLHINQFATDTLDKLIIEDFKLIDYNPQPKIKAELKTGL